LNRSTFFQFLQFETTGTFLASLFHFWGKFLDALCVIFGIERLREFHIAQIMRHKEIFICVFFKILRVYAFDCLTVKKYFG